jgi:citrate lyase subunit beta/citryl-CoA lyase
VRINAIATRDWQNDLAAVVAAAPDGIMLPKSRSGEDVHQLSVALGHAEERDGLPAGAVRIIALATEVPVSLLQMPSYVGASSRLEGLTWGAEDLSAELGAEANRDADGNFLDPYRLARALCLAGAAVAEVSAIDTVYVDFRNEAGLKRECEEARRDGFTGKLAIHPAQVPVINEVFTPTAGAIAKAKAVIDAFAAHPGKGTIGIDGVMYDRPHLERAKQLIARASAAGIVA